MASLLDRYMDGDRERVWHELRQLGAAVREPQHLGDATAVAREAMTRARENVETLIERLRAQGYEFGSDAGATVPWAPPDEQTPGFVGELIVEFGPIPLTLQAWIEVVGDVSLLGTHPAFPSELVMDPLVVEVEYKSWARPSLKHFRDAREVHEDEDGLFFLDVAPDDLHKAKISGGAPYGIAVPDACADGHFRFADGVVLSFVGYLNLSFANGGFAGLRKRNPGKEGWVARHKLSEGLLGI